MWTYNHTDELYHHGVKGMKWGVRRANKLAEKAARSVRSSVRADEARRKYYTRQYSNKKDMQKDADELLYWTHTHGVDVAAVDKLVAKLQKKYKTVTATLEKDAKTGKTYVQSILEDRGGEKYVGRADVGIDYIRPKKA